MARRWSQNECLTPSGKIRNFPGDSKAGKHPLKRFKVSRKNVMNAIRASERIHEVSTSIRALYGLEPVPESSVLGGFRRLVGE